MLVIIVFIHTLFPEPVEPAINTCGILAISANCTFPATSFPSPTVNFDLFPLNSSLSNISLKCTTSFPYLVPLFPLLVFPGLVLQFLLFLFAKFNAMSSAKLAILLTLTPSAGFNSYLVIAGPTDTFSTFADTPKLYNVFVVLLQYLLTL